MYKCGTVCMYIHMYIILCVCSLLLHCVHPGKKGKSANVPNAPPLNRIPLPNQYVHCRCYNRESVGKTMQYETLVFVYTGRFVFVESP